MDQATAIRVNDLLRSEFIGGIVLMSPSVYALPPQMRGRALYRMSQAAHFTMDDHSEGVFEYADCLFYWRIGMFAGQRSITLMLGDEYITLVAAPDICRK
jgi:hypothetical protein